MPAAAGSSPPGKELSSGAKVCSKPSTCSGGAWSAEVQVSAVVAGSPRGPPRQRRRWCMTDCDLRLIERSSEAAGGGGAARSLSAGARLLLVLLWNEVPEAGQEVGGVAAIAVVGVLLPTELVDHQRRKDPLLIGQPVQPGPDGRHGAGVDQKPGSETEQRGQRRQRRRRRDLACVVVVAQSQRRAGVG